MAIPDQESVEFEILDVADELNVISEMMSTALSLTNSEITEYELLQQNLLLLILNRIVALNQKIQMKPN